jgi:transketolase
MRERFASTATDLLDADERAAIVLAEISVGMFDRAFEEHPDRVVNVGIMEQTMVGVAAGFAMEGFHPIVHTIAPFLAERPFEQLKLDFGYQGLGGTFVSVGASYDYAVEGGTHHAPGDVQAMLAIPGMRVVVPGHADELESLFRATHGDGRATYIRASAAQNHEAHDVAFGAIEVVRQGSRATVLAIGPMLSRTAAAADGLDVTILYATTIQPIDADALRRTVVGGSTLVVVEPYYEGTTEIAIRPALDDRTVRLVSIGVPRRFLHRYGRPEQHDEALGLDAVGIRRRIERALGGRP